MSQFTKIIQLKINIFLKPNTFTGMDDAFLPRTRINTKIYKATFLVSPSTSIETFLLNSIRPRKRYPKIWTPKRNTKKMFLSESRSVSLQISSSFYLIELNLDTAIFEETVSTKYDKSKAYLVNVNTFEFNTVLL